MSVDLTKLMNLEDGKTMYGALRRYDKLNEIEKAPVIIDTASGQVATFTDGADGLPLGKIVVNITPVQEGTGDPSPSNNRAISGWTKANIGRTAKNLLGGNVLRNAIKAYLPDAAEDTQNKTINIASNGTVSDNVKAIAGIGSGWNNRVFNFQFKENTRYTFVFTIYKNTGTGSNLRIYYTDSTYDNISGVSATETKETVLFVSASGKTVRNLIKTNSSGTTRVYYDESGIFEGVLTAQEFEAWKGNIYSIKFPALTKNLLSGIESGAINQTTGQDEADDSVTRNIGYIPVDPGETYTLGTLASSGNIRFFSYDEDKNYLGDSVVKNVTNATYTVSNDTHFIRFQGANERFTGVDIQFEKGSSHTSYEPFSDTVYGGSIIVNRDGTGRILVDRLSLEYDGDEDWIQASAGGYYLQGAYPAGTITRTKMPMANEFKWVSTVTSAMADMAEGEIATTSSDVTRQINVKYTVPETADAFKAFLAEKPLQIVMHLLNPVEYYISSDVIMTIFGLNNIYADVGAIQSVDYASDTKKYIDAVGNDKQEKIDDLQDQIDDIGEIISDVDSPVATTGHAIGEIFSCNNKLYIATQTIVSGDSIVEGTNVATTFSIDNVSYPLNVVKFMQKNLEKLANIDALIDEKARVLAMSPIDRRIFTNYKKDHAITSTSTVLRNVDVFYNELHTTGRNLSGSAYRAVILSRDDGLKNIGNAAEYNAVKSDFKPFDISNTADPSIVHPVIYISYYFERNGKNNPPQVYLYTYDSEDKLYYARFGMYDDDGFYESYLQIPDEFVTNGNIAIAVQFRRPNQSIDLKLSIIGMNERDMWEGMASMTLTNSGFTVIDDITPTT